MIRRYAIAVTLGFASIGAVAQDSLPQLSSTSLGDAKFGISAIEVERVLGRKLALEGNAQKAGVAGFKCGDAGLQGIPGVKLHFEAGKFVAAVLSGPPLTTKSGFAVGDPESKVIGKFRSDPTYQREPNHYAEPGDKNAAIEITLGAQRKNPKTGDDEGYAVKFISKRGTVKIIEAGMSSYVRLFEREGSCT